MKLYFLSLAWISGKFVNKEEEGMNHAGLSGKLELALGLPQLIMHKYQ